MSHSCTRRFDPAPNLAQLRDLGWVACEERANLFRRVLPKRGHHTNLDQITGFPVATDGVHLLVWQEAEQTWYEIHITNWVGPLHAPRKPGAFSGGVKAESEHGDEVEDLRKTFASTTRNPSLPKAAKVKDSDCDDLI